MVTGLVVRQPRPDKLAMLEGDPALEPNSGFGIPGEAPDGHGIQQFVAEDDAANGGAGLRRSEFRQISEPAHLVGEGSEGLTLPMASSSGGFDDPVFQALEELGASVTHPG